MTDFKAQMEAGRAWSDKITADFEGYFTTSPECGQGWDAILREFFEAVVRLVPVASDFSLFQVKEKFGELRIYYGLSNASDEVKNEVEKASEAAEAKSIVTCEVSGKPGSLISRKGWLCVRSPDLAEPGDKPLRH